MSSVDREYFPQPRATPPPPGAPTMCAAVWALVSAEVADGERRAA